MERVMEIYSLEKSLLAAWVVWDWSLTIVLFILLARSPTDQESHCLCSFSSLQWQNSISRKRATFVLPAPAYPSGLPSVPQTASN